MLSLRCPLHARFLGDFTSTSSRISRWFPHWMWFLGMCSARQMVLTIHLLSKGWGDLLFLWVFICTCCFFVSFFELAFGCSSCIPPCWMLWVESCLWISFYLTKFYVTASKKKTKKMLDYSCKLGVVDIYVPA